MGSKMFCYCLRGCGVIILNILTILKIVGLRKIRHYLVDTSNLRLLVLRMFTND